MLRPMGTPSTGSAMSVLNGQNPPHTWVLGAEELVHRGHEPAPSAAP